VRLKRICITACLLLLPTSRCFAQLPQSVICQFERIAIAELDSSGKIATSSEGSTGEMVISNLNSEAPVGTGNVSVGKLRVLRKSKDAIWLANYPDDDVVVMITLFFKSKVVMFTKHEILPTPGGSAPLGFVEIGRFRPLK
jgi:hypothetical protein